MSKRKSKFLIYGLIDPRDERLFYIGKSCCGNKSMYRHTQPHSIESDVNVEKSDHIMEIINDGYELKHIVLEECRNKRETAMRERVLIAKYRDSLLNVALNGRSKRGSFD